MNDEEDAPSRNECGGYYCSPEHGHIDCCSTPAEPVHEIEEDVCSVCGTLFKPLAGLRGAPTRCPECAAKRAEQGEAL